MSTIARACWHCKWWDGLTAAGTSALCSMPNAARVRSQPAEGCTGFERVPGVDDDPERAPAGLVPEARMAGPWRAREAPAVPVVVEWAP